MDLKLRGEECTDDKKPFIEEVGSTTFNQNEVKKIKGSKSEPILKTKFNWESAEKIDA